jgi:1-acyl-sn-glycerol-3-phosphate acyltransferase
MLVFIGITFPFFYLGAVIIWLLTYNLDSHLRFLHYYTCFWASTYTCVMPTWRIKIEGREKCRKEATYVIISNHQSQLDILVNFRLFLFYKIVSKSEMFRVPFMGWNMKLNQYIELVRGNKDGVRKMMEDCEKALAECNSVFIYPEGTRSPDGEIKDFKLGAFILAKKAQVPILPIVLTNTGKALPKWKMESSGIHRMKERVLDEIPYEKFAKLSVEETAALVRRTMIAELARLNAEIKNN